MTKLLLALSMCLLISAPAPVLAKAIVDTGLKPVVTSESQLIAQGYSLMAAGKSGQAVQILSQAVRLSPANMGARRYLAAAMLQGGEAEQATQQLQVIMQSGQSVLMDANMLGQAYFRSGRYDLAITAFQNVLRLEPGNCPAHDGLIDCYLASGQPDLAYSICSHGLRIAPTALLRQRFQNRLEGITAPAAPPNIDNRMAERPNS